MEREIKEYTIKKLIGNMYISDYVINEYKKRCDKEIKEQKFILYNILFLLEEIKNNLRALALLLKNDTMNGYYEVLRSTIELISILKYILIEKELIYKKIVAYEYIQMHYGKTLQEKELNDIEKHIDLLGLYNKNYTEERKQQEKVNYLKKINENIANIEKIMASEKYYDIKNKIGNKKFPKVYSYYNNEKEEINSYKKLCYFLKEERLYTIFYNIVSQINHGTNVRHKNDMNFLLYSMTELEQSLYSLLKYCVLNFLEEKDMKELKRMFKNQMGINFIDND